jgi:hypothetical protein
MYKNYVLKKFAQLFTCFWAGRWSIPGIHSLAASSYAERVNWQQVHTRNAWPGSKFIYGTHELAAGSYLERCAG